MTLTVGVIGLGAMGAGMARTLSGGGFSVQAFDLAEEARAHMAQHGVTIAENASAVVAACDVIVLSLPLARHVQDIIDDAFAAGALADAGKTVIDTSTSEADISRQLAARLSAAGHGFLDAPVSGGPQGAATGSLSMMIGGDAAAVAAAQPVLDALASKVIHVGASGAGNIAKLVNNMLVACHMLTTAEAMRLSEAAGLPAEDALRVINSATGRSAISEVHFPTWVLNNSLNSGFSAGLMRKDMRLALELAQQAGCDLPVARMVAQLWSQDRSGLSDNDDFMQIADLRNKAKLDG
ncbi:NAD(P)-dependent oxidoreductase [Paracoccus sp. Z330]|uniref:NAD(P)-dependent oxidoreductase n=1 Tax=Paracoccus onchidii TaxID=3017813 RepID=A0ABT4ZEG7_9RHOB|nr:NAD(P)-dependent oxidoreductase [Paracoccus onchidii]MDB6177121.1 NAD(P)-dependent oxidoreductase [Paracoccus onchidii]